MLNVIYCQLQRLKELRRLKMKMMGSINYYSHGLFTISLYSQHELICIQESVKHYCDSRCTPDEKLFTHFLQKRVTTLSIMTTWILLTRQHVVARDLPFVFEPIFPLPLDIHSEVSIRVQRHVGPLGCHPQDWIRD